MTAMSGAGKNSSRYESHHGLCTGVHICQRARRSVGDLDILQRQVASVGAQLLGFGAELIAPESPTMTSSRRRASCGSAPGRAIPDQNLASAYGQVSRGSVFGYKRVLRPCLLLEGKPTTARIELDI